MPRKRGPDRGAARGPDAEVLDDVAAAAAVAVLPVTVRRWCRSGRLRCQKARGGWWVRRADLDDLIRGPLEPMDLAERLGRFLAVPDRVLLLAEDAAVLRPVEAAVLAAGAAAGGRLVVAYDPTTTPQAALAAAYRDAGVDVLGLEKSDRLLWVADPDPLEAVALLGELLDRWSARGSVSTTWAVFDLGSDAAPAAALLEALHQVAAQPRLVAVAAVVGPVPEFERPGAALGTIRASHTGVRMSRPAPSGA